MSEFDEFDIGPLHTLEKSSSMAISEDQSSRFNDDTVLDNLFQEWQKPPDVGRRTSSENATIASSLPDFTRTDICQDFLVSPTATNTIPNGARYFPSDNSTGIAHVIDYNHGQFTSTVDGVVNNGPSWDLQIQQLNAMKACGLTSQEKMTEYYTYLKEIQPHLDFSDIVISSGESSGEDEVEIPDPGIADSLRKFVEFSRHHPASPVPDSPPPCPIEPELYSSTSSGFFKPRALLENSSEPVYSPQSLRTKSFLQEDPTQQFDNLLRLLNSGSTPLTSNNDPPMPMPPSSPSPLDSIFERNPPTTRSLLQMNPVSSSSKTVFPIPPALVMDDLLPSLLGDSTIPESSDNSTLGYHSSTMSSNNLHASQIGPLKLSRPHKLPTSRMPSKNKTYPLPSSTITSQTSAISSLLNSNTRDPRLSGRTATLNGILESVKSKPPQVPQEVVWGVSHRAQQGLPPPHYNSAAYKIISRPQGQPARPSKDPAQNPKVPTSILKKTQPIVLNNEKKILSVKTKEPKIKIIEAPLFDPNGTVIPGGEKPEKKKKKKKDKGEKKESSDVSEKKKKKKKSKEHAEPDDEKAIKSKKSKKDGTNNGETKTKKSKQVKDSKDKKNKDSDEKSKTGEKKKKDKVKKADGESSSTPTPPEENIARAETAVLPEVAAPTPEPKTVETMAPTETAVFPEVTAPTPEPKTVETRTSTETAVLPEVAAPTPEPKTVEIMVPTETAVLTEVAAPPPEPKTVETMTSTETAVLPEVAAPTPEPKTVETMTPTETAVLPEVAAPTPEPNVENKSPAESMVSAEATAPSPIVVPDEFGVSMETEVSAISDFDASVACRASEDESSSPPPTLQHVEVADLSDDDLEIVDTTAALSDGETTEEEPMPDISEEQPRISPIVSGPSWKRRLSPKFDIYESSSCHYKIPRARLVLQRHPAKLGDVVNVTAQPPDQRVQEPAVQPPSKPAKKTAAQRPSKAKKERAVQPPKKTEKKPLAQRPSKSLKEPAVQPANKPVRQPEVQTWSKPATENQVTRTEFTEEATSTPTISAERLAYLEKCKNYYQERVDQNVRCLLCRMDPIKIVAHYSQKHPEAEVHVSRLSPMQTEAALLEEGMEVPPHPIFYCRFCNFTNKNITVFYDHCTAHTGEYRFRCVQCQFGSDKSSWVKSHSRSHLELKNCPKEETYRTMVEVDPNSLEIPAYVCSACHYLQISRQRLEKHLELYHLLDPGTIIRKINLIHYESPDEPVIPKRFLQKRSSHLTSTDSYNQVEDDDLTSEDSEHEFRTPSPVLIDICSDEETDVKVKTEPVDGLTEPIPGPSGAISVITSVGLVGSGTSRVTASLKGAQQKKTPPKKGVKRKKRTSTKATKKRRNSNYVPQEEMDNVQCPVCGKFYHSVQKKLNWLECRFCLVWHHEFCTDLPDRCNKCALEQQQLTGEQYLPSSTVPPATPMTMSPSLTSNHTPMITAMPANASATSMPLSMPSHLLTTDMSSSMPSIPPTIRMPSLVPSLPQRMPLLTHSHSPMMTMPSATPSNPHMMSRPPWMTSTMMALAATMRSPMAPIATEGMTEEAAAVARTAAEVAAAHLHPNVPM